MYTYICVYSNCIPLATYAIFEVVAYYHIQAWEATQVSQANSLTNYSYIGQATYNGSP